MRVGVYDLKGKGLRRSFANVAVKMWASCKQKSPWQLPRARKVHGIICKGCKERSWRLLDQFFIVSLSAYVHFEEINACCEVVYFNLVFIQNGRTYGHPIGI